MFHMECIVVWVRYMDHTIQDDRIMEANRKEHNKLIFNTSSWWRKKNVNEQNRKKTEELAKTQNERKFTDKNNTGNRMVGKKTIMKYVDELDVRHIHWLQISKRDRISTKKRSFEVEYQTCWWQRPKSRNKTIFNKQKTTHTFHTVLCCILDTYQLHILSCSEWSRAFPKIMLKINISSNYEFSPQKTLRFQDLVDFITHSSVTLQHTCCIHRDFSYTKTVSTRSTTH